MYEPEKLVSCYLDSRETTNFFKHQAKDTSEIFVYPGVFEHL